MLLLQDAAELLAHESAGYSAEEVHRGLIAAFWPGEFERRRRSVVYTLEPVRLRYRSEPGQTPEEILVAPPPGVWVADDGAVYAERADGRLGPGRRRRVRWTRREVLRALIMGDASCHYLASSAVRPPTGIWRGCRWTRGRRTHGR